MIRRFSLTIASLCISVAASSMAKADDTLYIGLGIGSVDYGAESISDFDDPTGYELIAGTEVSRNLSLELSYIDFGKADNGTTPALHLEGDAFTVGALLRAKVGKTADVFLKLGMLSWDREITRDGSGVIGKDDGTDILYGFGVMVKATQSLSIGARYNVYDFDGDDVTMLSVNAQLGF
jgi:opacity protein-like surface antigen